MIFWLHTNHLRVFSETNQEIHGQVHFVGQITSYLRKKLQFWVIIRLQFSDFLIFTYTQFWQIFILLRISQIFLICNEKKLESILIFLSQFNSFFLCQFSWQIRLQHASISTSFPLYENNNDTNILLPKKTV